MTEERIEEVKDVIFYEAVEQTDTLPSEAEIQVTDEKTGQSIKALDVDRNRRDGKLSSINHMAICHI